MGLGHVYVYIYCAVVVAICPNVAGISVLWLLCKQNGEKALCLEDLEIICQFNVILNI